MNKWAKGYLWTCAGIGAATVGWIGYQYYRWSVTEWDRQEAGS